MSLLFSPVRIGRLELPGRLFKTATSESRASEDGRVTEELVDFYARLARGGTPLIITGNLYVSPAGRATSRMAGADADDKLPGLRRWAHEVDRLGSKLIAQLNHCGRQLIPAAVGLAEAVSASDVRELALGTRPRPLTRDEIRGVVSDFGDAAVRCADAGFAGVQIHAAHGYLLSQFLTPHTNRRNDEYGGSFENRLRLPVEVLREVRRRVGPDFPVLLKLNGADALPGRRGLGTADLVRVAQALQDEGIDAVEISAGHYESGFVMTAGTFRGFYRALVELGIGRELDRARRTSMRWLHRGFDALSRRLWPALEGFNLAYARAFKQALRIPVICVGGFHTRVAMEQALESGAADALSAGRAFLADPYLYRHLRDGLPGPRCSYCNLCLARAGTGPVQCHDPVVRGAQDRMLAVERESALDTYARHVSAEFETKRVDDAIATMVPDPYVVNLPSMVGGVGREQVREFYAEHFVFQMPPDVELVPVSRTVSDERVIEESVLRFTHTLALDWIFPGVPPTGRRVELAVCTVVGLRDGAVAYEHIYWDQASALAQIGLIDREKLPVMGAEAARQVIDPRGPVNQLLARELRGWSAQEKP
jgi:2,4-dienoyl-CoA reductase-like NADH-dependent reductase (Old Yellow Enzyme family)